MMIAQTQNLFSSCWSQLSQWTSSIHSLQVLTNRTRKRLKNLEANLKVCSYNSYIIGIDIFLDNAHQASTHPHSLHMAICDMCMHLAAAYHTLKDCAEQKKNLSTKIETTNEKIKTKRKQLENLREELKVLGKL